MMINAKGITFKLIFFILASSTLIFFCIFGYNYFITRKILIKNIEENAKNLTAAAANRMEIVLRSVEKMPQNLACFLEQSPVNNQEELLRLLRAVVENNPEVYGSTIAFEPGAFAKDKRFFAPYYFKNGGQTKFTYLDEKYNYFIWDWYRLPKELNAPVWTEPYFDEGGGNIVMSTYSYPLYKEVDGDKQFVGVVTADVYLSWLQDIVSSIKIGKTGHAFVISKNGTIVTHPLRELIMHESLFSVADRLHDRRLRQIGMDMIHGKSGFALSRSMVTMKDCWMAYTPLASTGWSLGVLFPQEELMADLGQLNHVVLALGLAGFIFLWAVVILISGSITKPLRLLARTTRDIAAGNLDFQLPDVKSRDEVGRLTESFATMRSALKKYIAELTQTTATKERMESELRIAHDIQLGSVPKVFPPFPDKPQVDLYAVLEPAKEVGGDLYDYFFVDENRLCFVIGDVSDKGVPAALFMMMTKTLIKTLARDMAHPDEILARANREIAHENDACMFITIFLGILDIRTGEMWYTNGGHNPPLLVRREGTVEFLTGGKSNVVGISEDAQFKKEKELLCPGDTLFMYTDGVTEAVNDHEALFSEEKLKEDVVLLRDQSLQAVVGGVMDRIKAFVHGMAQSDDITMVALRYVGALFKEGEIRDGKMVLLLKNDLSEVERLAKAVTAFGEANQIGAEAVNDVNLVLDEIVANIVSYGYGDIEKHSIYLAMEFKSGEWTIQVIDQGKSFNPLMRPAPELDKPVEDRPIGGLGVHLVRNLMDDLEYRREQGRNVLVLKKKTGGRGESSQAEKKPL